ncbi:MAG: hypothetical protein J4428_03380 [Candidatus Aenigmarchaeota archaeon]|nr:hypothetical protein [Candidatus Aenigmarchaeota archaeon]
MTKPRYFLPRTQQNDAIRRASESVLGVEFCYPDEVRWGENDYVQIVFTLPNGGAGYMPRKFVSSNPGERIPALSNVGGFLALVVVERRYIQVTNEQ